MATAFVRGEILCAWKGSTLLITTPGGACDAREQMTGLYFREARFLRTLKLQINGSDPWLCEAAAPAPARLDFNYVYPEISAFGGGGTGQSDDQEHVGPSGLPERAIDIRLSHVAAAGSLTCDAVLTNRARRAVTIEIGWVLDADFADIQEAQGGRREQEAAVRVTAAGGYLDFTYQHPNLRYATRVSHDPAWTWNGTQLARTVTLAPRERVTASLCVEPAGVGSYAAATDLVEKWARRFTRVSVPANRAIEHTLDCSARDIASFPLMEGQPDEWLAMQAGVPAYPAFFGRDAVTAGWQGAMLDRGESLAAALARLTRLQSNRFDDWRDEQPGRIPYQVRTGPLALLDINPYSAYYADFASPLMFVIALANLYAWTGEREPLRPCYDAARRILDWARELGDADGDGYLEYQTRSPKGTKNQGWKDSGDAIIYDDGSPVPSPIATCEVQGYWFLAQELMAWLSAVFGARDDAAAYLRSAAALKQRFNRDWWVEEERFIALALDPDKRQVRAVTSNVGHCVACGIIDRDRLDAVVERMFQPDLFSGWGIRTLSSRHTYYDPLSYHRGTVWAVEQATTAFGLRRFGYDTQSVALTAALFDLASLYSQRRIPECVGGYARGERATPGAYPRANTPQLWNASAFPLVVQSLLGIVPLAPIETLVIDPILPDWLPEVIVEGLRVGGASVDLRCWRDGGDRARWEVLDKRGTLHVLRQPPPEASAGAVDRFRGVLESLL